jgi:FkbM family methyltransferase
VTSRQVTVNAEEGPNQESRPDWVRAEQSTSFQAEDFGRFFACTQHLAELHPGYAQSYEFYVHRVLHALANREPDLFFLQIGGMDGKRFDPIYAFVKHYRWKGIILEPLADLFEALAANYAGNEGVTLVNAALTDSDGEHEMLRVRRQAVLDGLVPVWVEGLSSFLPNRNALGGCGVSPDLHATLCRHMQVESVMCLTLRSLAERYEIPRIDLLQVDAEGCELQILQQMDWSVYRPMVVQLEHWALPAEERGELLGILGKQEYVLRMSEADVLAVDQNLYKACSSEAGWSC